MSDETKAELVTDLEAAARPKMISFEAGARIAPIIPRNLGELAMVAAAIITAGLAPDSYQEKAGTEDQKYEKTKARIMVGVMKGAEVGLPPITALSTIAIINGRPTIWGDGAVALIQRSGLVEKIEEFYEGAGETDSGPIKDQQGTEDFTPRATDFPQTLTAVCRVWRRGQSEPYEGRFSVRDAMRAKLWGSNKHEVWIRYPRRMLKNRARAFALRDGFADCLHGLSIREEIEDLPAPPPIATDISFLGGPDEVSEAADAAEDKVPAQE